MTYLAKVTVKDTVNKTVTLSVTVGGATKTVKLDGKVADPNKDFYDEVYAMSKNDYVLLTAKGDVATATTQLTDDFEIIELLGAPKTATGKVSAIKGASATAATRTLTIGGEAYKEAAREAGAGLNLNDNKTYYLDTYGNIIGYSAVTESKDYAVVMATSVSGDVMNGSSFYAKLLLTDGTQKWVEVSKIGSTKVNDDNYTSTSFTNALPAPNADTDVTFVTYATDADGKYELSTLAGATDGTETADYSGPAAPANIVKNGTSYNDGTETYTLTNSTVFLFYNSKTKAYDAYKGLANLPSTTTVAANKGYVLQTSQASGVARIVLVTSKTDVASDVVFVYNDTATDERYANSTTIKTYKAIVDGVITTVEAKNGELPNKGVVYMGNSYHSDGYIETDGADSSTAKAFGTGITTTSVSLTSLTPKEAVYKVTDSTPGTTKLQAKVDGGVLSIKETDGAGSATGNTGLLTVVLADDAPIYRMDYTAETVEQIEFSDTFADMFVTLNAVDKVYIKTNSDGYMEYAIIVCE